MATLNGALPWRLALLISFLCLPGSTRAWAQAPVQAPAQAPVQPPIQESRTQQEERVPYVGLDVYASTPSFPKNAALADALGLATTNMPGRGVGFTVTGHVYPLSWRWLTLGVGGNVHMSRAHSGPTTVQGEKTGSDVNLRFTAYSAQMSVNFGHAGGWSHLSGGYGTSTFAYSVDGARLDQTSPRRKTINYGAGARWYTRDHLGFGFDLRFYMLEPQGATATAKALPRTTFVVFSAGVSFK